MSEYGLLLKSMGFLILIVILAYLAVRYGLRSVYRGLNGGYMKVLERTPLDPKSGSSLLLVQIGSEIILIGTAQGGVSLLKTVNWKDLQYVDREDAEKPVNFRESLNRVMQTIRKTRGDDENRNDGGNR
jgi:flagellar biosynthetic protein FliO